MLCLDLTDARWHSGNQNTNAATKWLRAEPPDAAVYIALSCGPFLTNKRSYGQRQTQTHAHNNQMNVVVAWSGKNGTPAPIMPQWSGNDCTRPRHLAANRARPQFLCGQILPGHKPRGQPCKPAAPWRPLHKAAIPCGHPQVAAAPWPRCLSVNLTKSR